MRYLVLGDIHGNLPALHAVLRAAAIRGAESCLFVGDLVGYGPEPLGCIAELRDCWQPGRFIWVAGNHDLMARHRGPIQHFIPEATQTLLWTRQLLNQQPAALTFLHTAPTAARVYESIWLTHDSLLKPGSGSYQRTLRQATRELAALRGLGGRVCFYGHTHVVRAEVLDDGEDVQGREVGCYTGADLDPDPLLLLPHETAWIGVGSVGLPTNRGRLAEFLILDTDDPHLWLVEKYAVDYPRYETRAQIHQRLLPDCSREVVDSICRWL